MREILCEKCGEKKAEFFYEENRNGMVKKLRLCAECAKKAGLAGSLLAEEELFSFPLFSHSMAGETAEEKCPVCKKSLNQIRKSGKFGCSACYDRFADRLDLTPFLGKDFHGLALTERPEKKEEKSESELLRLKEELKHAVLAEEYEKAALIRDKIRVLEAR